MSWHSPSSESESSESLGRYIIIVVGKWVADGEADYSSGFGHLVQGQGGILSDALTHTGGTLKALSRISHASG
jgi:hypothetical protein